MPVWSSQPQLRDTDAHWDLYFTGGKKKAINTLNLELCFPLGIPSRYSFLLRVVVRSILLYVVEMYHS